MGDTFSKYKNIILVIVIVIIVFLLYTFFLKSDDGDSGSLLLTTESLSGNVQNAAVSREFLTLLLELRSLNLDESFFEDNSFKVLKDFSQEVRPQPSGRENPFLEIGVDPVSPGDDGIGEEGT